MKKKSSLYLFIFILFILRTTISVAQISAPGSSASESTSYPVFQETDSIYIFCTAGEGSAEGALRAQTDLQGTKTFLWEKYNNASGAFEFYFSESSEAQESTINSLADGGYRVTITQGATTQVYRAWVFNEWFSASGEITESTCQSFKLNGTFETAQLTYYDLSNNAAIDVFKDVKVQWKNGDNVVAATINPQVFNPPAEDTDYTLRVYDRFGCESTTTVFYESIVTEAKFTVDPQSGEAPLIVSFNNQSKNGDPDQYEWFIYRDLDEIKREAENSQQPVDSIMIVAYDENPVYTFENSGTYNVKLVSKNISENQTCVDTVYIDEYIVVDTSFIAVPNVFTPNGDGTNDYFIVKFWSMQNIKISIFNRWGKRIHYWSKDNIRGFDNIWEETVWDGRLGGRKASPGVYYYVVEGTGRDNEKRRAHGFFHLFTDKE